MGANYAGGKLTKDPLWPDSNWVPLKALSMGLNPGRPCLSKTLTQPVTVAGTSLGRP